MNASSVMPPATGPAHSDAETIGLVGVAHGTSHFFHLLLPPLFPMLASQYGFSYAELGFLVTVFFIISGVGQALAGFVVDRIGPYPVLLAAMLAFALAALSASMADGYVGFMLAAALAGLGNAPFHPADFTILNKKVTQARLGHAFSIHGVSGNMGWAIAPLAIAGVTGLTGSWRLAMAACAVWALFVVALLIWRGHALRTGPAASAAASTARPGQGAAAASGSSGGSGDASAASSASTFGFLSLPSVWVCFSFFFWSTCALTAVQSFVAPAMGQLHAEPMPWLAMMVTGYMVFSAVGMLAGGYLVKHSPRLERTIALALGASAALLVVAGVSGLPAVLCGVLVALAGLGTGLAGPSRDMLIRQAAPAGATGRVYGTVYSGLDVGFASAAPVFGALIDHGWATGVFTGAAAALALGIASAAWVGRRLPQRQAGTTPAAAR